MMSYNHVQTHYASIPLPEQQYLLPYGDPSFSQKPDRFSSTLLAAQERASRKRVARTTCLIATGILISTLGMVFAFLSFICVFHRCQASSRSVVTTAPLGPVLTISQVTSHVAPLSVPLIMGLLSYLLSAMWLRSSIDGGPNCPSPMQLGLLMSMCNGAGLSSLFSTIKYLFKRPQYGEKVAQPPILRQSIFFLGSLLAVTYLTAAADSWLHASSTSILIPSNSPYHSLVVPDFGREINATMCAQAMGNATVIVSHTGQASCGLINGGSGGSGLTLGEGVRVVSNTSSLHRVVFADDQTALVVPQSVPPNITYSAQTLGVKTQCISITKECIQPETLGGLPYYGSDAQLDLNCAKAGIRYVNGTGQSSLCALDSQGMCTIGEDIESNPFTAGEIVTSMAYLGPGQVYDAFIPNSGWFVHGNNGAWNVVFCNVTALEVTYKYESLRYITVSSSPQPLTTARYIMSAGFERSSTTVISSAVAGAGLQSNTTFEEAYSLELSRQMLARAAFIYEPKNVLRIQYENNVNGSKLQLIPLVLFVGALLVFACQVLYIALRTVIATWGVQYVGLAARHLGDPLATMQRVYGHPDPALTWEMDSEKRFGFETERDRLRVGPVALSGNDIPGSAFMVRKA
ncbi:hypothetical protein GALMADRAFT_272694 [Galerina marginata CBS 339.88]|uniref:Transmembrane protein n=1 Tax=Galerina marginata (strain CBS 339.88) TaxID=685588 RepID=A0A067SDX0_GALM3|nr:hypothetical protein GALMADRAFT_272694 [Galerina marginata CBS 339.88]